MKKFFSLVFTFVVLHVSYAQSTMTLINDTGGDLLFNMFRTNSSSCAYTGETQYVVPANTVSVVTAPAGEEFFHAEITSFPMCWGGVAFDISTPQVCYSNCPGWVSHYYTGTNSGCGGALPNIVARWDDCRAPGQGFLIVSDY